MAEAKKPKKGLPSWLPIAILGVLNVFAAGALFYFLGKDYAVRQVWTKMIEDRTRQRDGQATPDLLKGLSESDKRKVDKFFSDYVKRKAAVAALLDDAKTNQQKIGEGGSKALAKDYGSEDVRIILHEFIKLRTPELRTEEQNLALEKDTLLSIREQYDAQIARLNEEIQRQDAYLKAEKVVTDKVNVENDERRRELAQLYSELEEAIGARRLAEGRERDMKDLLARTKAYIAELVQRNQAMQTQIRQLEGVAATGE